MSIWTIENNEATNWDITPEYFCKCTYTFNSGEAFSIDETLKSTPALKDDLAEYGYIKIYGKSNNPDGVEFVIACDTPDALNSAYDRVAEAFISHSNAIDLRDLYVRVLSIAAL